MTLPPYYVQLLKLNLDSFQGVRSGEQYSHRVSIHGHSIWRAMQLLGLISSADQGGSCRLRSVKRTGSADSHEPVPVIHKSVSLDLILPSSVTPIFPDRRLPIGISEVDGSDLPFFPPGSALPEARFSHTPHHLGGSLPSQQSLREDWENGPQRGEETPERGLLGSTTVESKAAGYPESACDSDTESDSV